jgi:predicted RNase H-like nuclease (RuvC/YqgF family)
VLGFVFHHFFLSKKRPDPPSREEIQQRMHAEVDINLKYAGEMEMKEREIGKLRQRLNDAEENLKIYEIEIEERSKEMKRMKGQGAGAAFVSNEEIAKLREQLKEAVEDNNILQIEVEERIKEVKKLKCRIRQCCETFTCKYRRAQLF